MGGEGGRGEEGRGNFSFLFCKVGASYEQDWDQYTQQKPNLGMNQ